MLDVVERDVLAEDGPRVYVVLFDRRAGVADERGVRQGVAHDASEAVGHLAGLFAAKPMLAAMHLIGETGGSSTGRETRPVADSID